MKFEHKRTSPVFGFPTLVYLEPNLHGILGLEPKADQLKSVLYAIHLYGIENTTLGAT